MQTVVVGCAGVLDEHVIDAMYEFRREVFVKRLRWSLELLDGLERDQYDRDDTVYFISRDEHEHVNACARLIPTTRAYMLQQRFPQLLGPADPPADPAIWELSRFATNVRMTREGRVLSLSRCTLKLLSTILYFASEHGIGQLVFVTSIGIERLILRTGIEVYRLAPPARVDDELCVALLLGTSEVSA